MSKSTPKPNKSISCYGKLIYPSKIKFKGSVINKNTIMECHNNGQPHPWIALIDYKKRHYVCYVKNEKTRKINGKKFTEIFGSHWYE